MNTEINKLLKSAPESTEIKLSIDPNEEDASQRLVVGFATLDNIDQTGDIVASEASLKAFDSFRGNIRLMHLPEPVGKVVDYQPAVYVDEATGKQYNGIQVTARISKAADNAWIMCQDGTISGFSIGGRVTRTSKQYDEDAGTSVNVIEEYVLTELSLVDNPANQFANITAIRKSADRVIHEGDEFTIGGDLKKVFEFKMEGGHPKVADKDINEEVVEKDNGAESEVVSETSTTAEEPETKVETLEVEAVDETEAEPAEVVEPEKAEEKEEVSEEVTVDIKAEIERVVEGFKDLLEQASDKLTTEFSEKMEKMSKEFEDKVANVQDQQKEMGEKIVAEKSLSDKLDEIQKGFEARLDSISQSVAMKKSVDNEPDVEDEGGTWKGAFTGDYRQ